MTHNQQRAPRKGRCRWWNLWAIVSVLHTANIPRLTSGDERLPLGECFSAHLSPPSNKNHVNKPACPVPVQGEKWRPRNTYNLFKMRRPLKACWDIRWRLLFCRNLERNKVIVVFILLTPRCSSNAVAYKCSTIFVGITHLSSCSPLMKAFVTRCLARQ